MRTRAEAETAIRKLALEWMHETGFKPEPGHYPSFMAFKVWLDEMGHTGYLKFRSTVSANFEAEGWFESEIRSYWLSFRQ